MDTKKVILIIILLLVFLGGIYYLWKERSKSSDKTISDTSEETNPSPEIQTQVQVRAEGENFSKLYGWSQLIDKVPSIIDSLTNLVKEAKNNAYGKNSSSQSIDKYCQIMPTDPRCIYLTQKG